MFAIARKAASRLRFPDLFNRAVAFAWTNTTAESSNAAEQSLSTRHASRNARSRRRFAPYVNDNASTRNPANSRPLNVLRDQYRGAAEVRTRVRKYNSLRKERSFQRALRAETPPTTNNSSAAREFYIVAKDVQQSLAAEHPKTNEDRIFQRGFGELIGDFVAANKVIDEDFARRVASNLDHIDEGDFRVQLEEERERVESAMTAREVEDNAQREDRAREARQRETERALAEERKRQRELEDIRLLNQARIREAEERHRRKEEERAKRAAEERANRDATERSRRLEELEARLQEERRLWDQERQARIQAERAAQLERERVVRLEEETRLAREREEQRLREDEATRAWLEAELRTAAQEQARQEAHAAQARAEQEARWKQSADEYARQRLNEFIQSTLNSEAQEGINQGFQAQEDRLRAHMEEAARAQAQAQGQWFYTQPEQFWQQEQDLPVEDDWSELFRDIPMGDPSFASIPDISMASIPPDDPPPPPFVLPDSEAGWFALYETRWQELRRLDDTTATAQLTFSSFPWPVFRLVDSLEGLDEEEMHRFFGMKYGGRLDRKWKSEFTRWHPDKFERIRSKIREECVEAVKEGFLRCVKVMNGLQELART